MKIFVFVLAFAGLLLCSLVTAQDNLKKWETFEFGKQKLTAAQLKKLELEDLQKMRGIVFGKHGRIFKEKAIQEYLE